MIKVWGMQIFSITLAPAEDLLYVGGFERTEHDSLNGVIAAYDANNGEQKWRVDDSSLPGAPVRDITVSPDGRFLYVTGGPVRYDSNDSLVVAAYDAVTGVRLWQSHQQRATGIAVATSPDGERVYVAGTSWAAGTGNDYVVAALDAATGREAWRETYDHNGQRDTLVAMALSPDGARLYLTGMTENGEPTYPWPIDFTPPRETTTVALNTSTGKHLWRKSWRNPPVEPELKTSWTWTSGITLDPAGNRVFVIGSGSDPLRPATGGLAAIVAYDAVTGARIWEATYRDYADSATGITTSWYSAIVNPDGSQVYVTGGSHESYRPDPVTAAYNTATGELEWVARYSDQNSPAHVYSSSSGHRVGVSLEGDRIYVLAQLHDSLNIDLSSGFPVKQVIPMGVLAYDIEAGG